jgi:hypothetical protein
VDTDRQRAPDEPFDGGRPDLISHANGRGKNVTVCR